MPTNISENGLETIIVAYLRDHHGYEEGTSQDYNKTFALDTERVKRFILATQRQKAENVQSSLPNSLSNSPIVASRMYFAKDSAILANFSICTIRSLQS